ncbi:hypothetical protein BCR43DRAFT_483216 [Syncephalastrum racemosum]|uniref:Homeobox domain-containing protein n=1 Tax=Syncephalastrum racemosum TaxID=13706 RepID=A0A1X2HUX1_SYNRA|nr:hypothetical protein BCR43DRAFT_483216 [Syncephalastrum racemosum]
MVKAKHNTRKQGRSKVTDNKVTDNKKSTKAINQLFRPSEEQKLTLPERRKAGEKMGPPQLAAQKDDTTAATCPKYTPHNLDANDKVKHAKSSSWPLLRPASHARGHYKVYTEAQVDLFFALMKEQNLTARQAALAAEINPRTGQRWAQDAKEKSVDGRRPKHWEKRTKLHSEHGEFLDQLYESNPKTTARMAQEELCAQFEGLSITPNGVYKYMQRRKHIQSLV